jgi:hypothetical protein
MFGKMSPFLPRRDFLLGTGVAGAAAAWPGLAAAAAGPTGATSATIAFEPGPIRVENLAFASLNDELHALVRLQCSLEPVDAPDWGYWTAYVVTPGTAPVPVVDFEAMELTRAVRRSDGSYFLKGADVSYPRDHRTGEFTSTARNPVTGETLELSGHVLTSDPGTILSPQVGWWPLWAPKPVSIDLHSRWWRESDRGRLRREQLPPPGSPQRVVISSYYEFPMAAFEDPKVTSIPYRNGGIYVFPFPPWMRMGDRPGHMLGMTSGRKLQSVKDLPRAFLERTEREHPELLSLDSVFRAVPQP